jgi:hypothetical protein
MAATDIFTSLVLKKLTQVVQNRPIPFHGFLKLSGKQIGETLVTSQGQVDSCRENKKSKIETIFSKKGSI